MKSHEILLGELKEFKRITHEELKEIRRDIKTLMSFKWRVIGAAGLASFLATIIVEIVRH